MTTDTLSTHPTNDAARLIITAQSVLSDLMTQATEIQVAVAKQQGLIAALMPAATWAPAEDPETSEE